LNRILDQFAVKKDFNLCGKLILIATGRALLLLVEYHFINKLGHLLAADFGVNNIDFDIECHLVFSLEASACEFALLLQLLFHQFEVVSPVLVSNLDRVFDLVEAEHSPLLLNEALELWLLLFLLLLGLVIKYHSPVIRELFGQSIDDVFHLLSRLLINILFLNSFSVGRLICSIFVIM
jgi:hypothetical protein